MRNIINLLQNECNVKIHIGPILYKEFGINSNNITNNFREEYNNLCITIEIAYYINEAINHINKYGSGHTDSIVTENKSNARLFINSIDTACVFHNASTRFNDGCRFCLGVEVGISTSRIHARRPVGVEGYRLLTTKFILISTNKNGDVAEDFIPDKDP